MQKTAWWQTGMKVIQYNLQVRDTGKMNPEDIARDARGLGADAVVLNTGGIYAWYESRVPFHHINEFLPEGRDLLKKLIEACHKEGVYVIGRFDFSKAEDEVYLQHPEWFVKDPDGKPVIYGKERMGNWSLLVSTCINGGYRWEEFAGKVLEEAIGMLELDGVFFNAPHMEDCWCENCRRKYRNLYGVDLPGEKQEWNSGWKTRCLQDNMEFLYRRIKAADPALPVIMYYSTYQEQGMHQAENLEDKYKTADLICTEAQDILSAGKESLPYRWKPILNMKLGRLPGKNLRPFGIIHSCPGMDWRHTGLPAAEYEYWMSQIPAAGGQLWHSLTGFDRTITDHRMLETVRQINEKTAVSNRYLEDAAPVVDAWILWSGSKKELAMAKAFLECHISFEFLNLLLLEQNLNPEQYPLLMVADGSRLKTKQLQYLREYVARGGRLFVEKTDSETDTVLEELMGIVPETMCTGSLQAAYGELPETSGLRSRLEQTRYLPVRGQYLNVRPVEGTQKLITLIPPFAPPDGVGAPPERASMSVGHTEIPLAMMHPYGKGNVLSVCFELAELVTEIGLEDQKILLENLFAALAGENLKVRAWNLPDGVHLSVWEKQGRWMLQIVNGIGERPLRTANACGNLEIALRKETEGPVRGGSVLEHYPVRVISEKEWIRIQIDRLDVWDLIVVEEERDGLVEEKAFSNDTK